MMVNYEAHPPILWKSFTIVFHLGFFWENHRIPDDTIVGIYTDDTQVDLCGQNRFSISVIGMDLAVQIFDPTRSCYQKNKEQVDEVVFKDFWLQNNDIWKFVAIGYDAELHTLTAYGENGFFQRHFSIDIPSKPTAMITLGNSHRNGKTYKMTHDTAISCLTVYGTVLNWEALLRIQCACNLNANQ